MPIIKDFGDFRLYMYFGDENPPHVHVIGPDFAAKMRVADQIVFAGDLKSRVEKKAAAFVAQNRTVLFDLWNGYQ